MRIVKLAPNRVTIELETPDCIGLVSGLYAGEQQTGEPLYAVLGSALLAAAYAAYLLARDDDPRTVAHMWEMWAPGDSNASEPGPLPHWGALPEADTHMVDGLVFKEATA
jgi:hypothetical protein